MNQTKIEWVKNPDGSQGYTWNPITGCLNHVNGMCKGGNFPCYAYRLAHGRLKHLYLSNIMGTLHRQEKHGGNLAKMLKPLNDPFYPRFWPEKVKDMDMYGKKKTYGTNIRKPKGIFVCDMSDLFGIGIPEHWTKAILLAIKSNPQYRFYLLTKQPQNLIKFSPFPSNCWVGVTITESNTDAGVYLMDVEAKVKFISFEPLLRWANYHSDRTAEALKICGVNWVIIGAQTKPTVYPKIEWVEEIIAACDKAGAKVFLKDNLRTPILDAVAKHQISRDQFLVGRELRQEMPETN